MHEGKSKTNVTVEVSCSLVLLPEQPMVARKENQRVGYFTTSRLQYGDRQQEVTRNNYITRWRLEPRRGGISARRACGAQEAHRVLH